MRLSTLSLFVSAGFLLSLTFGCGKEGKTVTVEDELPPPPSAPPAPPPPPPPPIPLPLPEPPPSEPPPRQPTNQAPMLVVHWPPPGALMGRIERVVLQTRDDLPGVFGETRINGVFSGSGPLNHEERYSYLEADFTGMPDGAYTLTVVATDSEGAATTVNIPVIVDAAKLRQQALAFLFDVQTWHSPPRAVRWPDSAFPLVIKVHPDFGPAFFSQIEQAAAFWERYAGIPGLSVQWGEAWVYGSCDGSYAGPPPVDGYIYIQPRDTCVGTVGIAWIDINEETNEVSTGVISVIPEALTWTTSDLTYFFAHELGHLMPCCNIHTANGSIMDATFNEGMFFLPADTAEAFRILYYELQPGEVIPQPAPTLMP